MYLLLTCIIKFVTHSAKELNLVTFRFREDNPRLQRSLEINPFFPTVPTFAVRETASLGMMGAPRVPPLNPSETIVLSEHYRL